MQISSRFTIAVHIFTCIAIFEDKYKVTSEFLAGSINVNPVIIRNIISQLKSAGLVSVNRGKGGASISKPLNEINLLDIYNAVESLGKNENLFSFHEHPNPNCPVGNNIHNILDFRLVQIQQAMEDKMRSISLKDIIDDAKNRIS